MIIKSGHVYTIRYRRITRFNGGHFACISTRWFLWWQLFLLPFIVLGSIGISKYEEIRGSVCELHVQILISILCKFDLNSESTLSVADTVLTSVICSVNRDYSLALYSLNVLVLSLYSIGVCIINMIVRCCTQLINALLLFLLSRIHLLGCMVSLLPDSIKILNVIVAGKKSLLVDLAALVFIREAC